MVVARAAARVAAEMVVVKVAEARAAVARVAVRVAAARAVMVTVAVRAVAVRAEVATAVVTATAVVVSRYKNRWRGLRILAADFSILVSAFEFPSAGAGIWDASHFRFLDSRCKSRVGDGQEMTHHFRFRIPISRFSVNPGSVKGRRLHHSRFRILISRFPVQNRPSPHGVSGEFISRFLIPLSIGT